MNRLFVHKSNRQRQNTKSKNMSVLPILRVTNSYYKNLNLQNSVSKEYPYHHRNPMVDTNTQINRYSPVTNINSNAIMDQAQISRRASRLISPSIKATLDTHQTFLGTRALNYSNRNLVRHKTNLSRRASMPNLSPIKACLYTNQTLI